MQLEDRLYGWSGIHRQQRGRGLRSRVAAQTWQRHDSHAARRRLLRAQDMNSIRTRLLLALIVLDRLRVCVRGGGDLSPGPERDIDAIRLSIATDGPVPAQPDFVGNRASRYPPDQGDTDFVVQIWDPFGSRVYLSRPGLPIVNQIVLGYADLSLQDQAWRAYGLQNRQRRDPDCPTRSRPAATGPRGGAAHRGPSGTSPAFHDRLRRLDRRAQPAAVETFDSRRPSSGTRRSLTPLASEGLPSEIKPLVGELNRLLIRLGENPSRCNAISSRMLRHELRSAAHGAAVAVAAAGSRPGRARHRLEARSRLGEAVGRAIHLVEQLLALARTEPREAQGLLERTDLAAAAAHGLTDTHALADARRIDLSLEAAVPVFVRGDAEIAASPRAQPRRQWGPIHAFGRICPSPLRELRRRSASPGHRYRRRNSPRRSRAGVRSFLSSAGAAGVRQPDLGCPSSRPSPKQHGANVRFGRCRRRRLTRHREISPLLRLP